MCFIQYTFYMIIVPLCTDFVQHSCFIKYTHLKPEASRCSKQENEKKIYLLHLLCHYVGLVNASYLLWPVNI